MDIRSSEHELRILMAAGLGGDAEAYKRLLALLSSSLRAYFKRQLAISGRGPVEAEDLVQETLIAIHTRRHTYDPSQLFTPWLYAIARYKLIDHLRQTKMSIKDLPIKEAKDAMAEDDPIGVESTFDLHKLMAQIPAKARQAIQYVKLDGLSVSEAAARSGMSEPAVKISVHRGLKALANLINKDKQP